jgi:hypothetical protein
MRAFVLAVALAACGKSTPAAPATGSSSTAAPAAGARPDDPWAAPPRTDASPGGCERLPFAPSLPVAEASGAALLDVAGLPSPSMIVVGDSGNHGEYVLIDPGNGDVREHGHLPLPPGVSDDLEGIASPDTHTVYGLVSDGTLLSWTRDGGKAAFVLASNERIGDDRSKNYEGLCLSPAPASGACEGFAASKADGRLWCLRDGRIDPGQSFPITGAGQLADCNFSPDGKTLLAAANAFGDNEVWQVDPLTGVTREVGAIGPGFGETVLAGPDGVVYRFSDMGGSPSLAGKYRCAAAAR